MSKLVNALVVARDRGLGPLAGSAAGLCRMHLERRILGRRYQLRRVHGYRMLLDAEDAGLSRGLFLWGTREVDHKVMLERIVRPGMTIFDIGGNIGYYPLMELALLNGTGCMVVVEPSPANISLLKRNLALNGHAAVPVIAAAVSDAMGRRGFHLSAQSNLGTFHPEGTGAETLTGETVDVETVTVPWLAEQYGAPDLIRMDVEGHEVEVINGMREAIAAGTLAPQIIFEPHLSRYGPEHDMAAALRALFDLGYRCPMLSSSSERGTGVLEGLGYTPGERIATDGVWRTLFYDIAPDHLVAILTETGGARTVLLARG